MVLFLITEFYSRTSPYKSFALFFFFGGNIEAQKWFSKSYTTSGIESLEQESLLFLLLLCLLYLLPL